MRNVPRYVIQVRNMPRLWHFAHKASRDAPFRVDKRNIPRWDIPGTTHLEIRAFWMRETLYRLFENVICILYKHLDTRTFRIWNNSGHVITTSQRLLLCDHSFTLLYYRESQNTSHQSTENVMWNTGFNAVTCEIRCLNLRIFLKLWRPVGSKKTEINGRGDPLRWPRYTLYPQQLTLTSSTCGGRSVGIFRLRTKVAEFSFSDGR
jgi:hypothetical protein